MWNEPSKKRLDKIPRLYDTEDIPLKEKNIHLHFFLGSCDWFAAEFDGDDVFFGFVVLNGDLEMAEWGYFSLSELKEIRTRHGFEIDCELEEYWKVRPAKDVGLIAKAQDWKKELSENNKGKVNANE